MNEVYTINLKHNMTISARNGFDCPNGWSPFIIKEFLEVILGYHQDLLCWIHCRFRGFWSYEHEEIVYYTVILYDKIGRTYPSREEIYNIIKEYYPEIFLI